jgi:hypothetical protein
MANAQKKSRSQSGRTKEDRQRQAPSHGSHGGKTSQGAGRGGQSHQDEEPPTEGQADMERSEERWPSQEL